MNPIHDEAGRLEALQRLDLLDTPKEPAFDRLARVAKKLFDVPMAFISLLDAHRQWFKACDGLDGEVPRQQAFCNITIQGDQPLVIPDATADPRVAENPFVTGPPGIRFYAGIPLRTADGFNIGAFCISDTKPRPFDLEQVNLLSDLARIVMDEMELRMLASTDTLTSALSRRAFKEAVDRAIALALRHHNELSCLSLDVDYFKRVNDRHGHAAGDKVLIEVVAACRQALRKSDALGRLGGEEFAVLLPQTGREAALDVAEKLRAAIAGCEVIWAGEPIAVTASFGVAVLDPAIRDTDSLLAESDAALYEAKAAGRNRVIFRQLKRPATLRRRVLKGGKIIFNNLGSSMDCTVRSLSDDGAGIDVFNSLALPKRFDLSIDSDAIRRACKVTEKSDRHLEVEFV